MQAAGLLAQAASSLRRQRGLRVDARVFALSAQGWRACRQSQAECSSRRRPRDVRQSSPRRITMISVELVAAACATWLVLAWLQWRLLSARHQRRLARLQDRHRRAKAEVEDMLSHCRRQIADLQSTLRLCQQPAPAGACGNPGRPPGPGVAADDRPALSRTHPSQWKRHTARKPAHIDASSGRTPSTRG